jgi:anti-sigma factor RsiW
VREIEKSAQPRYQSRTVRWWQALALGASTAVMGALGGWWLAQPRLLETFPELAVARHVASLTPAGPRIDVASSDRHEVRPWFQGRLEFAPMVRDLSGQGFDLLGARVDRVGNRQAVAVVYRLHNHIINVFSWRGSGDVTQTAMEATIRGFHVVTWSDRDMEFAAVSDTDSAELRRFIAAYRVP